MEQNKLGDDRENNKATTWLPWDREEHMQLLNSSNCRSWELQGKWKWCTTKIILMWWPTTHGHWKSNPTPQHEVESKIQLVRSFILKHSWMHLLFFSFFLEFEVLIGRYISRVVTNWKVYYVRGARNTQLCPFKCAVENASSKIFNILLITL